MDHDRRPHKLLDIRNNKIYMDLKDIIRESALPFVPAKSLFRFRSVCRDWKLQISSPFFAHNQSLSCDAILGFFVQVPDEPPSFVSVDQVSCGVPDPSLSFLPEPVVIRSSSNGLLCCQGKAAGKAYYICNPVTQQWKKLPKPNADHGRHPAVVLVFEPSLLNFEADYKLVCAFPSNDFDDATEFEIYSSKEGSWKISAEISFADLHIDQKSGVHVDGIVYWKGRGLLAFDLAKDRSQVLVNYSSGLLGTTNGKLCIAHIDHCSVRRDVLKNAHSSSCSRMRKEGERVILDRGLTSATNKLVIAVGGDFLVFKAGENLYSLDFRAKEAKLVTTASYHPTMTCLPYVNNLAAL